MQHIPANPQIGPKARHCAVVAAILALAISLLISLAAWQPSYASTRNPLPYDDDLIAEIGWQRGNILHDECCPAYCCAYGDSMLTGEATDHSYYGCYSPTLGRYGCGFAYWERESSDFGDIYNEIDAGRPVIMHVVNNYLAAYYGSQHWILVIGYTQADWSLDSLIAIDPADGSQIYVGDRYIRHSDGIIHCSTRGLDVIGSHVHEFSLGAAYAHDDTTHWRSYCDCECGASKSPTLEDCEFCWDGISRVCGECGAQEVWHQEDGEYYVSAESTNLYAAADADSRVLGQLFSERILAIGDVTLSPQGYWMGHVTGEVEGYVRLADCLPNGNAGIHNFNEGVCQDCGCAQVGTQIGWYEVAQACNSYLGDAYEGSKRALAAGETILITKVEAGADNNYWGITPDGYVVPMSSLGAEPIAEYGLGEQASIPDGVYLVSLAEDDSLALDISGASQLDCAQALLYAKHEDLNQQFLFTRQEDGSYVISNVASGKALDVNGASWANGANVIQYEGHGADNQRWYVETDGQGHYYLRNKESNLYLSFFGSALTSGINACQYQGTGDWNQTLTLALVDTQCEPGRYVGNGPVYVYSGALGASQKATLSAGEELCVVRTQESYPGYWIGFLADGRALAMHNLSAWESYYLGETAQIADGEYVLVSAADSRFALDINGASAKNGAALNLYQRQHRNPAQIFTFAKNEDGTYFISARCSGLALDASGLGTVNCTDVIQWAANGGENQSWYVEAAEDGSYYLRNKCNNLYLDIEGGALANCTSMILYEGHGGLNQRFKLIPLADEPQPCQDAVRADGTAYTLSLANGSGLVLDAAGKSPVSGANISAWKDNAGANQQFTFELCEDGTYIIRSVANPMLVLDASGKSPASGANISAWKDNGGANQRWLIYAAEGGYIIANAANPLLVLDAAGASPVSGANISAWVENGGTNQIWTFTPSALGNL